MKLQLTLLLILVLWLSGISQSVSIKKKIGSPHDGELYTPDPYQDCDFLCYTFRNFIESNQLLVDGIEIGDNVAITLTDMDNNAIHSSMSLGDIHSSNNFTHIFNDIPYSGSIYFYISTESVMTCPSRLKIQVDVDRIYNIPKFPDFIYTGKVCVVDHSNMDTPISQFDTRRAQSHLNAQQIFPNPTSANFIIKNSKEIESFRLVIFNSVGREVTTFISQISKTEIKSNFNYDVPNGLYYVIGQINDQNIYKMIYKKD